MRNTFLHNEFSDNSEPPVAIPAPEVAWDDMHARLERDLPHTSTAPNVGRWILLFIFLAAGISVLLITDNYKANQHAAANTAFKNGAVATERNNKKPRIEEQATTFQIIQANKQSSFTNATLLNAEPKNETSAGTVTLQNGSTFSKAHTQTIHLRTVQKFSKRKTHPFQKISTSLASSDALQNLFFSQKAATILPITHADTIAEKNAVAANEPIHVTTPFLQLRAGLQWSVPLPLAGGTSYFGGANGTLQPYAVLIPGVWVSLTTGRNNFAVDVQPLAMALLKTKSFSTTETQVDATTTRTTIQALQKILGLSAGIQSQYNIHSKWWLGGSFQGSFWKKGIINTHTIDQKQNGSNDTIIAETKTVKTASFNDLVLTDFSKFQLFVNTDVSYQTAHWETGLRTGVTFVRLAQRAGPAYQFQALLFLRLRLLQKNLH